MKRRIIRSAVTPVNAATDEAKEQVFKENIDQIEDDFSFVLAGIDKLFRNGGQQAESANKIASKLSESLQECTALMAEEL